jgi:hypothetical protein
MKRIMSLSMKRKIERISHFGKNQRRTSHNMNLLGDWVDQDGILSAQLCVLKLYLARLIFTQEERILSSLIMTMK